MSDFFEKEETPEEDVVEAPETPSTIKVGDKEYSPEDLQGLVQLGEIGREAEDKYNTKLDRVWQDYGKTKNELKTLQDEYEGFKSTAQQPINTDDEDSVRQAKEAAKKLGLVTNDDFDNYLNKSFRAKFQEEMAARDLIQAATGLEKKYDGADGRPRFEKADILDYMQDTGINDPEKAYKLRYESQLDKWKETQLEKSRRTGFYTEEGTGATAKAPKEVRVTKENISRLMNEALDGLT